MLEFEKLDEEPIREPEIERNKANINPTVLLNSLEIK